MASWRRQFSGLFPLPGLTASRGTHRRRAGPQQRDRFTYPAAGVLLIQSICHFPEFPAAEVPAGAVRRIRDKEVCEGIRQAGHCGRAASRYCPVRDFLRLCFAGYADTAAGVLFSFRSREIYSFVPGSFFFGRCSFSLTQIKSAAPQGRRLLTGSARILPRPAGIASSGPQYGYFLLTGSVCQSSANLFMTLGSIC